ncbi:MAG: hypothetical protein IT565_08885 [Rhodospirillales bacterium]|nr:hypothetical protein [Rhodospirillales bacterium]
MIAHGFRYGLFGRLAGALGVLAVLVNLSTLSMPKAATLAGGFLAAADYCQAHAAKPNTPEPTADHECCPLCPPTASLLAALAQAPRYHPQAMEVAFAIAWDGVGPVRSDHSHAPPRAPPSPT